MIAHDGGSQLEPRNFDACQCTELRSIPHRNYSEYRHIDDISSTKLYIYRRDQVNISLGVLDSTWRLRT